MHPRRSLLAILTVGLFACGGPDSEETLVVFAAASLSDVAGDLAAEFERGRPNRVVYNFAGSNTLAQQIRAAPGADVFLSADEEWVDVLDQAGRTVPGSRRSFLSNRLVLIAHRDADYEIDDPGGLASAAFRFLAVADPQAVPAGRYAKAALERVSLDSEDLWTRVSGRLAPTLDVRAALALVESDPEILGIVYRTDAITSEKVRVLHEFPPLDDAPIVYSAVLVADGDNPELGRRYLDFLTSSSASEIAERLGFTAAKR